jgi:hypothetical protein
MRKPVFVYFALTITFGLAIVVALGRGRLLERDRPAAAPSAAVAAAGDARAGVLSRLAHPLPRLLLQLIVIVAAARLFGALFRRLGQPPVIGEIVAGIALGPSLLGLVAPGAFAFLFEPASVGPLKLLAEIGVLLFLFGVGLELDPERLKGRTRRPSSSAMCPSSFPTLSGSSCRSRSTASSPLPAFRSRRSLSSWASP